MTLALRILPFLKKYRKWLLLSAFCHLGMALFTVVSIPMIIPFFRILFRQNESGVKLDSSVGLEVWLHDFFSRIISTFGTNAAMVYVCLALVAAFFFRNLFRYLSLILMAPLRNGIVRDLRGSIHKKLLFLPLKSLSEERRGDLMARATIDIQEVDWSILSVLESIFKSPFILIGSLTFMILINLKLTLFALVLMVFTGVVIAGISRKLKKDSQNIQKKIGELTSIIEESLHGIKILKIFSGQKYRIAKFDKENQSYYLQNNAYAKKRELSSPLSEFLGVSSVVALLWFGSSLVFKNEILPETFFAFILAFYQLIEPTKQISNAIFSIQKGNAALDRIFAIVNLQQEEEEVTEPSIKLNFSNSIQIENLSFTYPNADFPALENINLSILKGEKIGIVGESGSGKSTLVDIIVRLHQAYSGNIYLDNHNIQTLPLSPYRALFGMVTQEPILFNDTVSQNIQMSANDDGSRLTSVLKTANAYKFIKHRIGGVYYQIGERGNNLSGGERQRITIARALYKDPPILIFDEATSSLDPLSEEIVKDSLSKALLNRTAIIIAHKLATIKDVDRIIVMDKGKIVEEGSFTKLTQEGQYFKRIIDKSFLT